MLLSKKKKKEKEERERLEREEQERLDRERLERDRAQREEQQRLLEMRQEQRKRETLQFQQQQQLQQQILAAKTQTPPPPPNVALPSMTAAGAIAAASQINPTGMISPSPSTGYRRNQSPGITAGTPVPGAVGAGATGKPGDQTGSTPMQKKTPSYPWSQKLLQDDTPFPRCDYSLCSVNEDIWLFAGLGKTGLRNDLVLISTPNLNVRTVPTMGDIPLPRDGHVAVNCGSIIILFGGECEDGKCEDFLYILRIDNRTWQKVQIQGNAPIGRRDHAAVVFEGTMYIFGGQTDGYFLHDLVAFDANSLFSANPRWEYIEPANEGPTGRAGHTACVYQEKIYIFGGTDGDTFFNEMWCYDIQENVWQLLVASGHTPPGRAGHAACIIDDCIYVTGGKSATGKNLSDVIAFRIRSKRWYTFQNMGPAPSARSGHVMTSFGNKIYVLNGEAREGEDPCMVHVLDAGKIKYPNDPPSKPRPATGVPAGNRAMTSGIPQMPTSPILLPNNKPATPITSPPTPSQNSIPTSSGGSARNVNSMMNPRRAPAPPNSGGRSAMMTPPPQASVTTSIASATATNSTMIYSEDKFGSIRSIDAESLDIQRNDSPSSNRTFGASTPIGVKQSQKVAEPINNEPLLQKSVQQQQQITQAHSIQTHPQSQAYTQSPAQRPVQPSVPQQQSQVPLSTAQTPQVEKVAPEKPEHRYQDHAVLSDLASVFNISRNVEISPKLLAELGENDGPKQRIIQQVVALTKELREAKMGMAEMAKTAADRIAFAEKSKQSAMKEAAYLKAKLTAISSGSVRDLERIGDARAAELENKLSLTLESNQQLQESLEEKNQELSQQAEVRARLEQMAEDAERRVNEFEKLYAQAQTQIASMADRLSESAALDAASRAASADQRSFDETELRKQHKKALETATATIKTANERAAQAEKLWIESQEQVTTLEHVVAELRGEAQSKQTELDRARSRISDLERLWTAARNEASQLEAMHSVVANDKDNGESNNGETQQLRRRLEREAEAKTRAETALRQAEASHRDTLRRALDAERMWAGAQKELTALKRRSIAKHDQTAYLRQQLQRLEDQLRRKERECDECQMRVTALIALIESDSPDLLPALEKLREAQPK